MPILRPSVQNFHDSREFSDGEEEIVHVPNPLTGHLHPTKAYPWPGTEQPEGILLTYTNLE